MCVVFFGVLTGLTCCAAIACTLVSFYTCAFMSPFNINCSAYVGYGKLCCNCCNLFCDCTYYMYSPASYASMAVTWTVFVLLMLITELLRRRHYRAIRGDGIVIAEMQMNNTGGPFMSAPYSPYGY